MPVKEIKENESNEVKNLFINEYKNVNNYYCSRTDIPKNYSFVNHKKCKKINYFLNIGLYITLIFEYIIFYIILSISLKKLFKNIPNIRSQRTRRRREINLSNNEEELRNRFPNNRERNVENDRIRNRNFNNEGNRDNIHNRFRAMANELNRELNRLRDFLRNSRNLQQKETYSI
jgi:hypothetical protein